MKRLSWNPADGPERRATVGLDDFGAFYEAHVDAVLAYHQRRTLAPQVAADLTAETFAAALVARHRFVPTGAPVTAWLFGIARRQLGHYIRREVVQTKHRRRLSVSSVSLDDEDIERVERLVDIEAMRPQLINALNLISADQAKAICLRVGHELPYAQVAEQLGCKEATARARVCRGLARLADLLGEEDE